MNIFIYMLVCKVYMYEWNVYMIVVCTLHLYTIKYTHWFVWQRWVNAVACMSSGNNSWEQVTSMGTTVVEVYSIPSRGKLVSIAFLKAQGEVTPFHVASRKGGARVTSFPWSSRHVLMWLRWKGSTKTSSKEESRPSTKEIYFQVSLRLASFIGCRPQLGWLIWNNSHHSKIQIHSIS